MNAAKFFASIRDSLFGGKLSQDQVSGMNSILTECGVEGASAAQTAYILATAFGESGGRMQPVRENMNYSAKRIGEVFSASRLQGKSPASLAHRPRDLALTVYGGEWGLEHLGNRIGTDDGWTKRGAGTAQITGFRNFDKWGKAMGLPLVDKPELLEDVDISARALVRAMIEGWATGIKLSDHINSRKCDFVNARRVWNGMFEARKYADNAELFLRALKFSGYTGNKITRVIAEIPPRTPEAMTIGNADPEPQPSLWRIILTILGIGKAGK